jgi:hypothetical protein
MRYFVCAIIVKHDNGYGNLYALEAYTGRYYGQNGISITILTMTQNNWQV